MILELSLIKMFDSVAVLAQMLSDQITKCYKAEKFLKEIQAMHENTPTDIKIQEYFDAQKVR